VLHKQDRAFEQDVVVEVEILLFDLFRVLEMAGSRVVHQDVQALELPFDVLAEVAYRIRLADVAELRDEPVSELPARFLQVLLVYVRTHYGRAFLDELSGDLQTDSGRSTCNEYNRILEHIFLPCVVRYLRLLRNSMRAEVVFSTCSTCTQ